MEEKKSAVFFLFLILISSFLVLFFRLFWLQVIKGHYYRVLSDENRIKIQELTAPRGVIYDYKNNVLVRNRPDGREYVYGPALAHVTGYIGEASPEEIQSGKWKLGDILGKFGLEKYYDSKLRGENGGVLVETDVNGNVIREISRQEPKAGEDLKLNIDSQIQKKATELLANKKGAIVITSPKGEVLTLASSPSFDPNIFTLKTKKDQTQEIENIFSNPDQPFFDRVIAGLYPPGSTFKIVTSIAGLEEGKIDKNTLIEDTGQIKVGIWSFANWYFTQYGKTEGMVNLVKALKRSNDIYYYRVGELLGITKLASWANYFGFGRKTEIDLQGETEGLVPTPDWKKENKGESWYLGDTFITAIGQGNLLTTPLQINMMASVVANNGFLCQPKIVESKQETCEELKIKKENLALVKQGMEEVCSEGGTAWPFFDFKPQVACKTGTAEYGDPKGKTHAWFTVFAPADDPEIVLTVLLEEAGEGSDKAAPLAKEILKEWFKEK